MSSIRYCSHVGSFYPVPAETVEQSEFFPSWVKTSKGYVPPIPWPTTGDMWEWDEDNTTWITSL
jgi:hypothetical protein